MAPRPLQSAGDPRETPPATIIGTKPLQPASGPRGDPTTPDLFDLPYLLPSYYLHMFVMLRRCACVHSQHDASSLHSTAGLRHSADSHLQHESCVHPTCAISETKPPQPAGASRETPQAPPQGPNLAASRAHLGDFTSPNPRGQTTAHVCLARCACVHSQHDASSLHGTASLPHSADSRRPSPLGRQPLAT